MKSVWNSCKAAFAMFSKIPTPMVDWNKENMKYMMCFFPFVGAVIGVLTWLVGCVLENHVELEPFFLTAILTVIPVFVTGGIHVDGLLDTSEALSSWQERTRRLEILKDSHAGAFAIITACVYFILWLGAWSQLQNDPEGICIVSIGFMMSRCLSGIGVITFPKARTDGTVAEFSRNASEIVARNILTVMFVVLAGLMIWINPVLTLSRSPTPMIQIIAGTPQIKLLTTLFTDSIVDNIPYRPPGLKDFFIDLSFFYFWYIK